MVGRYQEPRKTSTMRIVKALYRSWLMKAIVNKGDKRVYWYENSMQLKQQVD